MKWLHGFSKPAQCGFCESPVQVPWGRGWLRICQECQERLELIRGPCCRQCGRRMDPNLGSACCDDCKRWGRISLEANRSVCTYNRFARELIWMLKFRGKEEWAVPMGEMMVECLWETGWKAQGIAFVPLHPDRLVERGFNQAERLARVIADSTGLRLFPVLERVRPTRSQSRRGRLERLAAMSEAFRMISSARSKTLPRSWILVDDVYTTGATLVDCARALKEAGDCRVRSLTFAR